MAVRTRWFTHLAKRAAHFTGTPACFVLAIASIVAWAAMGPLFRFGDTWQLVINTATTIVTFLMVFLIQNTQNRDTEAMQIKLDELLRSHRPANNALLDLEELEQEELDTLRQSYEALAAQSRERRRHGGGAVRRDDGRRPDSGKR